MYAVCTTEGIWKALVLPLTDKVKDGLCVKYLLCRGGCLEPHRSRSTLLMLLQPIITMAVLLPEPPRVFASHLKIISY